MGLTLGTVFAVQAKLKYNKSLGECHDDDKGKPNLCTAEGVAIRSAAREAGDGSTIAFIGGGAALTAGVILWLTQPTQAPPGTKTAMARAPRWLTAGAQIGPGRAGISVMGSF